MTRKGLWSSNIRLHHSCTDGHRKEVANNSDEIKGLGFSHCEVNWNIKIPYKEVEAEVYYETFMGFLGGKRGFRIDKLPTTIEELLLKSLDFVYKGTLASHLLTGDCENSSAFGNFSDKLWILNSSENTAFTHFLKVDILEQTEQMLGTFRSKALKRSMQI